MGGAETLPLPAEAPADPASDPASRSVAGRGGAGSAADAPSSSWLAEQPDDQYHRGIARLGIQVAEALAYAHKRNVLHRDIKPSNLLLDALGNARVTDFGLAKFEDGDDLSRSRDVVGTMRYMSPERFRGVSDRSGDLYALGATLYELLTLRPAFEGCDQLQLIDRIAHQPPVPPRQLDRRIPRDLETILLKALAKEPKDRFASADEMAAELQRFLDNRPIRSRAISPGERCWQWCKRNPLLAPSNVAAAALTIALAISSTAAALTFRAQRDDIRSGFEHVRRAETSGRERLFEALIDRAQASRFSRRPGQRVEALDALAEAPWRSRSASTHAGPPSR